jgi:hypothetical protein
MRPLNLITPRRPHVRFGSLADIGQPIRDVRFTPKSRHVLCLRADPWRTDLDFGEMTDSRQIRQTSALLSCPREATSAALGPYFGHPSRLNFCIERRDSMLRRYATFAFAVLGLLVFDWEDPSPEAHPGDR